MAEVTYDDRSFLVEGTRIWLVSGEIHYFRIPADLWPDRLLKAKRAGLNCVSTAIAWNVHEPAEGQWQFDGGQDVVSFVNLAGQLGLYVILRPGPFFGGEWDFGGLPGWLTAKTGVSFRTSNAAYTHYYDKYLAQILPRLAPHQVTRGGNIVLIQNENDYIQTTMPDRLSYLDFVTQLFRRSGFEIPVITSNRLTRPEASEAVECVSGFDRCTSLLKRTRRAQHDAPLMVVEFRCGSADRWGGRHGTRDALEVARRALEVLGCGAQFNYYMWHGGTNLGLGAGRFSGDRAAYGTTSCDGDAPLAEGGGLTEKYYLTRPVNMLAASMGRYFAQTAMPHAGVTVQDSSDALNIVGREGAWAVVTNNGRSEITEATISLGDGREFAATLQPYGAAALPVDIQLTPVHRLDHANLTPLGFFDERALVFHGPVGWDARVSINGRELRQAVPGGDSPTLIEHQGLAVLLINSDLATRTWPVDETLVFGPTFVAEEPEDVTLPRGTRQYTVLPPDGKLTRKRAATKVTVRKSPTPRLGTWKVLSVCREPVDDDLEWKKIDRPRDLDRLGVHRGYGWYRVEMNVPRAKRRNLFLPDCEDRATLFLNGSCVGTWGRDPQARRSPIAVNFRRGRNVLTALVENLGRYSSGPRLGESKGLFGHVHDARPLRVRKFKVKPAKGFAKRIVPRPLGYLLAELEQTPVWSAELDISLAQVRPIHVSFADVPYHLCVFCNERNVGFFPREEVSGSQGAAEGAVEHTNWGDVTLAAELRKGKNRFRLLVWGEDVDPKLLDAIHFHALSEAVSQDGRWSFRRWEVPRAPSKTRTSRKRLPTWFHCRFKYAGAGRDAPLFLRVSGARKGQLVLNGHNVGRFWNLGPQEYHYLPSCWLSEENEILLFDETGRPPSACALQFRPLGPYRQ
jgi:hypothetical protein